MGLLSIYNLRNPSSHGTFAFASWIRDLHVLNEWGIFYQEMKFGVKLLNIIFYQTLSIKKIPTSAEKKICAGKNIDLFY